jgi:hypothetical protein
VCFTSILSLAAVVLRLGVASLDSFRVPAYSGLHDPVRGLHGDCAPLLFVELFLPCSVTTGLRCGSGSGGCVDISIRSESGVDPYFCLSMSNPLVAWQKECFF